MSHNHHRIGFVATRLAGTDGVSLETMKWVSLLQTLKHECFCFAGESDWLAERTLLVPEAHFNHPLIQQLNKALFDSYARSPDTSQLVQKLKEHLKGQLYRFMDEFDLNLLIVENALSLPMNVPLGLALTEFIAETNIPTIAHHHDFAWERERYAVSAADDYLRTAFPPSLRSIQHVVINSFAGRQLALRTGAGSILIPNVMDFETPPPEPDLYTREIRPALGIDPDEILLLQPTRIVPRKRIEHAINFTRRIGVKSVLVISHESGDEGTAYEVYLRDYAQAAGVRVLFASEVFAHARGQTPDGRKVFSLADAYLEADLVTYPSRVEGFGNAFLETVLYRRPIVMSTYEIFKTDIQPKGFQVIGFEDFITDDTIHQAQVLLKDPLLAEEKARHNFELGRRYYSYRALERHLTTLVSEVHHVTTTPMSD